MPLRTLRALVLAVVALAAAAPAARAFCGFYVAKADSRLFNEASQVVIARHGDRTVISMVNDYRGDPREFALVVPVPQVLAREQIRVADRAAIAHLDAYTAPRLVEYFDPDPCRARPVMELAMLRSAQGRGADAGSALGVTVEARYTVGEYDILILSAEESSGLETWLTGEGYRVPDGAAPILEGYIAAGMHFFVAKVNLRERSRLGFAKLRPLQIAFTSQHFMLPIRLGMVNAAGPQELLIYTLTRGGRVESANYRTLPMPSDLDLPIFVRAQFGDFYRALFTRQVESADRRGVFLEYAWDMAWCDPCAADPLSVAELRELGALWLDERPRAGGTKALAREVFVTRLHLRYDAAHFPDDLMLRETGDRQSFQGRYVLRHPWRGTPSCRAAESYLEGLPGRFEREAQTLASLTDWPIHEIRDKMALDGQPTPARESERD